MAPTIARGALLTSLLLALARSQNAPTTTFLTLLTREASEYGAVALDGSPAAYYYRVGAERRKFYIHTQGGGYCLTNDDCYARSQSSLGSSKGLPATQPQGDGYFSTDPKVNPLMYNWTLIYFPYLDGSFQLGDVTEPVVVPGKGTIYYRGARIVRSAITNLIQNTTVNLGAATDVVISGCSAGGVSTFMHADMWAAALPNAKVAAMPDSGFVLNFDGSPAHNFTNDMVVLSTLQNTTGSLPSACLDAHPGQPHRCMFPEEVARTMKTPTFPLQAQFDQWQAENEAPNTTAAAINAYGSYLNSVLDATLLDAGRQNGVFLDSCYHHCGNFYNNIHIDGDTQASAFYQWYTELGQAGVKRVWKQGAVYPCTKCCQS